jgi:outer membrane protein assembly factor BamA
VKYEGAGDLEQTKIDESLREHGADIKLDAFLDQGVIRRARTVLRDLLAEKGFAAADVSSAIEPIAGSTKLVSLVFHAARGPKLVIRDVVFTATARSRQRPRQGAEEQPAAGPAVAGHQPRRLQRDDVRRRRAARRGLLPQQGYVAVRVGQPECGRWTTPRRQDRFVQLRIPVHEGRRYRVGTIASRGRRSCAPRRCRRSSLKPGVWYRQERIRDGLTKAREIYGRSGTWSSPATPT